MSITLDDYDFELPDARIAQRPAARRRDARLLVWGSDGDLQDAGFASVVDRLNPGDLVVLNDTRVFPARLFGHKQGGGARVEVLLLFPRTGEPATWEALVRPSRRLPGDSRVELDGGAVVTIGDKVDGGRRLVHFPGRIDPNHYAAQHGHVPLPPYIRRPDVDADRERYQTVFARQSGSVAAPTAGFHWDEALLESVGDRGVELATVTLHVGPGTFLPLQPEDIERRRLHEEWYHVPGATLRAIAACRARGGRVVVVGTTACRALESVPLDATDDQTGRTSLMIAPGHVFHATDVLITNFHLPRSSLLLLVAAFAGERWREAYAHAVAHDYRFYSYGDANWIEP